MGLESIRSQEETVMINRRDFLKLGSLLLAGGVASQRVQPAQAEPLQAPGPYGGPNLAGWKVTLGDALYNAPGEPPVDITDIKTVHSPGYSEVRANVKRRVIMAHNITYKQVTDPNALNYIHTCSVSFRLPYLPVQDSNATLNGQTVEGGIFIWDGPNTRLDYGMAFQWLVNPWGAGKNPPGSLFIWNGAAWVRIGKLPVNTAWHTLRMVVDFKRRTTLLLLDNKVQLSRFSATSKDSTWGNTVDARFQLEAVSIDPRPANTIKAMHRVQYKNWKWVWEPASG
jgi:hypothetical protein